MVRRGRIGLSLLTAVAAALIAGAAAGHGTSARPDLAEVSVAATQHAGKNGLTLRVTDVVRNAGSVGAPRSTIGYYLSRDRQRGRGDTRLGGRTTGSLRAGASERRSVTLLVPASVKSGSYRVVACADAGNGIRESNETNNCVASTRLVRLLDRTPPTFGGLKSAVTCIPGPLGEPRQSSYRLNWDPALDNVTPTGKIVYDIYQATTEGAENYAKPTYVSGAGAMSFATPPLPSDRAYFFVVRARDRAGNREQNKVERVGQNICL